MEFPRQEYWNGLPFSPPGDLPNPGIKPESPVSPALAGRFFTTEPQGKPLEVDTEMEFGDALCLLGTNTYIRKRGEAGSGAGSR